MLFGNTENRRKQFSAELKQEIYKEQRNKCMYCGRKSEIDLMDIDHKNPISKGGSNTKRNLQLLCRTCNTRKGATTDRQFRSKFKSAGVPATQTPPATPIPQSKFDAIAKKTATVKAKKARTARQQDPFGFFR